MYQEQSAQKEFLINIEKSQQALEVEKIHVTEQKKLCAHLLNSTQRWNNALAQHLQNQKKAYSIIEEHFLKKQQVQYHNFLLKKNYQALMPIIYSQLEQELQEYFRNTAHQEQYLQQIFNQIQTKSSE